MNDHRTSLKEAGTTTPWAAPLITRGGPFSRPPWQQLMVALLVLAFVLAPTSALAAPVTQEADWESGDAETDWTYGDAETDWAYDDAETDWAYSDPQWIEVDLTEQWLTAAEGDTPICEAPVSTAMEGYETPEGEFAIETMLDSSDLWGADFYYPDVPYVMLYTDLFAIHSAYWHEDFGYPVSHGCVNLSVPDAEWLYNWASIGTGIWIHY